ncbi:MAG TPA: nitronate monooxygenase [Acidothermaceae bacterium]|nr:nitronate monooxygenase [Acidothermaceae bacterium]
MATPNLLGSELPLAAAPMAGGPSTPRLAAAVTSAGAFAFVPGGYQSAEALAADIADARRSAAAFGVNLFVPSPSQLSAAAFQQYARALRPEAERYGVQLPAGMPVTDDAGWAEKLDLLLTDPVPVVSTTFGLPRPEEVAALRKAGSRVLVTVTTVEEARSAADVGADGLVAQGSAAGAHSGTHDPARAITAMPTSQLTRDVIAATGLPTVAAGGVDGPRAVTELLAAGACAVAIGTLLLRTDESGASQVHKDALADSQFTETVITRAFTGRPARALRNRFVDRYDPVAPTGFPAINALTRGIRQAAAAAGDPHGVHLWAGTGYRSAPTGSARGVIEQLAQSL